MSARGAALAAGLAGGGVVPHDPEPEPPTGAGPDAIGDPDLRVGPQHAEVGKLAVLALIPPRWPTSDAAWQHLRDRIYPLIYSK